MSEDMFGDLPDAGTFRAPTHEEVPHRILATEVRVHTVAKALREVRGVLGRIFWMAAAGVVATVVSSLVSGIWIGGWRGAPRTTAAARHARGVGPRLAPRRPR